MSKKDFFLLAQKYLDGKATEQEKQQLNDWYDSFDDSAVNVPVGEETEKSIELQMLTRLKESLQKESKPKTFVLGRKSNLIAAAAILVILLTGAWFVFLKNSNKENQRMAIAMDDEEGEENEENKDGYDHPREADAFQTLRTRDLSTGKVPMDKMWEAVVKTNQQKEFVANSSNILDALNWAERGPDRDAVGPSNGNTRANSGVTSGRIDAMLVDMGDPTGKTVWIGGDMGGVWKTTDITASPANWTLVNDFFGNLIVSAFAQDPTNSNTMYFATGEGFTSVGAAVGSERGIGIFKSTDHGVTWNLLPSTAGFTYTCKMLCDNAGNIYVGTVGVGLGLQRSNDGGATWTNISPTGFNNVADLELSSTGRLHMTARSNQGYRFTDIPATATSAAGWTAPTTDFSSGSNRAEIGSNGNTLYCLPSINNQIPAIWKSVDGGVNWTNIGAPPTMSTGQPFANGQGFYDLAVAVNPANADECIIGGVDNAKTTNGGTSWTTISAWVGTTGQYVHADQHTSIWYDNGNKLLFGCDGGIHYSSDKGVTIRDRNVGLRLKQFYACDIHPTSTNYFLAGAQDNGTHQLNGAGLTGSIEVTGGDGGYVAIDQDEPQFQTATYVYCNFRRSSNGGANWSQGPSNNTGQFINPYDYDDANDRVYAATSAGSYLRWENPQAGFTYTTVPFASLGGGTIASAFVSPNVANRVYFGTTSGVLARADDANATPTGTVLSTGAGFPAGAYLNSINMGSTENNLVATFTNYGINNIFISTNGGVGAWTAIDGNLPNMPVYWAVFHPDDNNKMYIATETGVWETDQINGASTVWTPSPSFPTVRTTMLKYRAADRILLAATYGRGLWTATVPLPSGFDLGSPAAATAACPAPASMSITLTTTSNGGFVTPITFTATGAPAGTTIAPIASVVPGNSTTVTLNGTNTLTAGNYTIQVTGSAAGAPDVIRNLTFTITAGVGPTITTQPAPQIVCAGTNTSFSVVASGTVTYQWQVSTPAVPAFTNIAGETAATLTLNAVTAAMNGNQYRVIVNSQCGSTTSNAALLTVNTAPAITTQPQSATLCAGSNNTFSVTATGTGISYQWQISTPAVPAFTNIPSATSASYTENAITAGMNGNQYRVIVTGTCPSPVTSNAATLTVVTSVGVTTQPVNTTACDGSSASFTVAGNGTGVIYQWQVNTGSGFVNIPVGAPYSGINTGTLTINPVSNPMNNYQYRALLSNATCTTPGISNTATLTVNALPSISANPQSATICSGAGNTFSVTASGTGISYQWQMNTVAAPTFVNIPGANSATYSVTNATVAMSGNQYRVVVTGTCSASTATSAAATLTVIAPVTITTQPANVELCSGNNATFSVVGASVPAIIYQWQVSTDGGGSFTSIPGATSSTYTVNSTIAVMNNNRYRVQLSNSTCTTPTVSNAATLTVRQLPTVGLTASQTSLSPGQVATLTATPSPSTGGTLTTSWIYNGNPLAVTGNTYVANVEKIGTYQVRIQETWPSSLFCSNLSQVVTLDAPASSRLFIFPSPNDGRFTVSYYNNGGATTSRSITIYDSRGSRVVHKYFTIVGSYTLIPIDIRRTQKGQYYVVVGDANGKVLADGKVMVQ